MTHPPAVTRFGSRSAPGSLSRMMLGSGRGCATVTCVTITPSSGGMIGRMVFCFGLNIHTLYSGGAVCGFGAASAVAVHGTIAGGVCVLSIEIGRAHV